jgi:PhzF family phenazine biosynthesis protein
MPAASFADVFFYDAFTTVPGQGNPAGIVLDARGLDDAALQQIARQVGFNETGFVLPSPSADLRLRFFTPGHEMDLCGHGAIAALRALSDHGRVPVIRPCDLTIETRAGLLPVRLWREGDVEWVRLQQAPPQFLAFDGEPAQLAAAIGLAPDDLDPDLPILYGSTGIWTLLLPVRGLSAMRRMRPDNPRFPGILTQKPRASVHPFCLETLDPACQMHGRHFSSPLSGTVEDPVTGTASGVMGAYYATVIQKGQTSSVELNIEQGHEIGRSGQVRVSVQRVKTAWRVAIAGTAVHGGGPLL